MAYVKMTEVQWLEVAERIVDEKMPGEALTPTEKEMLAQYYLKGETPEKGVFMVFGV